VAKKTQTQGREIDIPVPLVRKTQTDWAFSAFCCSEPLSDHKFGKISRIHGDPRASTVRFVRLSGWKKGMRMRNLMTLSLAYIYVRTY